MLAGHDATASYNNQVMRNIDEALINRDPKTSELVGELGGCALPAVASDD